jgi:murein DD-endopeptidase MepM/ murein hydrolase activator NlpD
MKKKTGFYIIALLGIGLITTSIMISRGKAKDSNEAKVNPGEDFIILNEEEPYMEISRMEDEVNMEDYRRDRDIQETFEENLEEEIEEEPMEDLEDEPDEPDDLNYTLVDGISSMELENMLKPIDGELGLNFTNGNLVYSKTLEEWTNHNGVDILATEGTEVKAALSGIVTEVYRDELWGIVIIIDHGNGFLTKYVNLSEGTNVVEGSNVQKGDIIGSIGQTATIEMMEEAHLHFEIIENGINKNPLDYLPEFSISK